MTSEEAKDRYIFLSEIRRMLRDVNEHGLANLVNDRMCAVHNFMEAGDQKEAEMFIQGKKL